MEVNTIGTKNCLDIARFNPNKPKVLFASTSEVYGQPQVVPQKETYYGNRNSFGNRSLYDVSKAMGESFAFQYIKEYKIDVKIARIFNTYGPHMQIDDGRVVTSFIQSAMSNKPFQIYGNGQQYRCFTYVDDLVDGLIKLMKSDGLNYPVNLGSNFKYSILDTANLINEICGKELPLEFHKIDKDDPRERIPDLTLARTLLDYNPKIEFKEGLKKTINWFKEQNGI